MSSFAFGSPSGFGTSTPAKRMYYKICCSSLQILFFCFFFFGYVSPIHVVFIEFRWFLAAFGSFSFSTPATSAPPAFGTPAATQAAQTSGFGMATAPAFGQPSFGAQSESLCIKYFPFNCLKR